MAGKEIEHTGIVQSISDRDHKVTVNLLRVTACSSCHVKSVCAVSENDQKTLEIISENGTGFIIGEQVKVCMGESLGMKALMIGYFIPFLVFMATLIIALQWTGEAISALIALGILIPYYLILILFREKLKSTFTFKIMKM